jgi:2-succinyl-5-enolpyruvyl-6-hydroxy-3-cyclohexene-1-carboxylate synthase
VIASEAWPDPTSDAVSLVLGPVDATLFALAKAVAPAPEPEARAAWRERLARLEVLAWRLVEEELARPGPLGEPRAVRSAVAGVPDGATLVLGNSLPLREVDAYCPPAPRELRIGHQRGANGIDGLVSGAAGMASASGKPTALLLGDLAFLHDTGGLWPARELETPFAIVVLDNGGGRIFEQLPLARSGASQEALRYWITPHRLELAAAAGLYGVPCSAVATPEALEDGVARALEREGPSVVLARVEPHSASESRERLLQRLSQVVRSERPW